LKERRPPNAIEDAAEEDVVDETVLESGAAHDTVAAPIVDDAPPETPSETIVHENANGAVAEITPDEEAAVLATVAAVLAKMEPQPAAADDNVTRPEVAREDADLSAAKRAIMHEWENWSALHSDELDDPNVAEYFFQHLQNKKSQLLNFSSKNDNYFAVVRLWVLERKQID
jgi:hypothetical protein